ncbi:MAG: LysR family transcriptional regulator [Clostridia bacterium]|nr:LysR family transcriptional regulator [Clostridia bacterium]
MRSKTNQDEKSAVVINNQKVLNYDLRLFINSNGLPGAFGIGIADLMHGIQQYGSLSKAAEEMGMAYSKAWKILRRIEDYLGFQLVFRQVGRGCGSSLTAKGEDFLNRYDAFVKDMENAAAAYFHLHFDGF